MEISFRDKKFGWRNFSFRYSTPGDTVLEPINKSIFYDVFLNDYCLRPSCYNCAFRNNHNLGDLIIGDFWNISNVYPDMDDDKGISSVLINTEIGNTIFEDCKDELVYRSLSVYDTYQPALSFSPVKPEGRSTFFSDLNKGEKLDSCYKEAKKRKVILNSVRRRMGLIRNVTKVNFGPAYKKPSKYWILEKDKNETMKESCCGCSACKSICPRNAISLNYDSEGFLYPNIDESRCIKCGLCYKVCPILSSRNKLIPIKAYACYAKDDNIRLISSSGGIFTIFAKKYIEKDGVVFGAASRFVDGKYSVVHVVIDNEDDLEQLRGSKYVQSDINSSYIKVKEILADGRPVLFTGTPCQVAGLKSFLMKPYENLNTISIICHGVAPTKVVDKYISELHELYHFHR